MKATDLIDNDQLRDDVPDFAPGDEVKVHVRRGQQGVHPGGRGNVIARQGGGLQEYTVRKLSYGVGVERTFPLHTPTVTKIEVVKRGDVRRAKLYYLRGRTGKAAKIGVYFLIVRPFWAILIECIRTHADRRQEVRWPHIEYGQRGEALRRGGTSAMDLRSWRGTGAVGSGDRSHPATRPHACGRRGQGQEERCLRVPALAVTPTKQQRLRRLRGWPSIVLVAECQSASTSWQSPAMTSTCTKTF